MKTKILVLLSVPLLLALAFVAYLAVPWLLIFIGIHLEPNPPRPEITYGEFPFRLEYEINGERKVIQDTLICEYDGIGANEGQGKYRKWKERLASGNKDITLLKVDETKEIYYPPGSSDYYMDDLGEYESSEHFFPDAAFIEKDGRFTHSGIISADQLLKEYNIKLISWDASQPIKNSFPVTKSNKE
ncbi:MAG: hypothetical protein ACE3JQ_01845 [Paenisporosarcina sp.]